MDKQTRSACKNHTTQNLFCTFKSHGNAGFELCNSFCVFFFFFQAQNIPLCLEKLAHRSHECNVLTEPLNVSALTLPICTQCAPIFLIFQCSKQNNNSITYLHSIVALTFRFCPTFQVYTSYRPCLSCRQYHVTSILASDSGTRAWQVPTAELEGEGHQWTRIRWNCKIDKFNKLTLRR